MASCPVRSTDKTSLQADREAWGEGRWVSFDLTCFHFGSLCFTRVHLVSLGLICSQRLVSLGFTWFHLGSFGFARCHGSSMSFTLFHSGSLGLTWFHVVALGITWFHKVSLALTWFHSPHLVLLGLTYFTWFDLVSLGSA